MPGTINPSRVPLTAPQIVTLLQPADRSIASLKRLRKALPHPSLLTLAQNTQLAKLGQDLVNLHGNSKMAAYDIVPVEYPS